MNLYLISQSINDGYDSYDSAVVAAKNEEGAKNIHPNGDLYPSGNWSYSYLDDWVHSPDQVEVKLIGKAVKGTEAGVILASFNAG